MRSVTQPLKCVFLDVAGTLWPEPWPNQDKLIAAQEARLREVVPAWPERRVRELRAHLVTLADELSLAWTQDTPALIARAATDLGLVLDIGQADAVRRAMCLPARDFVTLMPGAAELLDTLATLQLDVGIVTNSSWRGAQEYRRDLEDFGISRRVRTIVTSVDTGLRKPHPGIFACAVELSDCVPQQALMVGRSERDDIEPAGALSFRTIRLALREPTASAADAVAPSLEVVARLIRDAARSD